MGYRRPHSTTWWANLRYRWQPSEILRCGCDTFHGHGRSFCRKQNRTYHSRRTTGRAIWLLVWTRCARLFWISSRKNSLKSFKPNNMSSGLSPFAEVGDSTCQMSTSANRRVRYKGVQLEASNINHVHVCLQNVWQGMASRPIVQVTSAESAIISFIVNASYNFSTFRNLTVGVPPGSLLSPLLFTVYPYDNLKTKEISIASLFYTYSNDIAIWAGSSVQKVQRLLP